LSLSDVRTVNSALALRARRDFLTTQDRLSLGLQQPFKILRISCWTPSAASSGKTPVAYSTIQRMSPIDSTRATACFRLLLKADYNVSSNDVNSLLVIQLDRWCWSLCSCWNLLHCLAVLQEATCKAFSAATDRSGNSHCLDNLLASTDLTPAKLKRPYPVSVWYGESTHRTSWSVCLGIHAVLEL
jgi:hypothetical protein